MRSPAERRLAYQCDLVRAKRLAAGIPLDDTWRDRLRQRWPERLQCSMDCGPGWSDIVEAVCELIDQEGVTLYQFTQIKEKFAGLRMYWSGEDPAGRIDQLVEAAEEISFSVCERCGSGRAKVWNHRGYVYTACDEHVIDGSTIARIKSERLNFPGAKARVTKIEGEDGQG